MVAAGITLERPGFPPKKTQTTCSNCFGAARGTPKNNVIRLGIAGCLPSAWCAMFSAESWTPRLGKGQKTAVCLAFPFWFPIGPAETYGGVRFLGTPPKENQDAVFLESKKQKGGWPPKKKNRSTIGCIVLGGLGDGAFRVFCVFRSLRAPGAWRCRWRSPAAA